MFQKIKLLSFITILLGVILIACQKQDNIQQTPKPNSTNLTLARTDAKDYRIPKDTAVNWTTRFRNLNKTTFNNKMPTNLLLPINGIEQMLQLSSENRKELSGIRLYLSVNKDHQITALYVPVDKNGNDILYYENEANFNSKDFAGEDGTSNCPPGSSCLYPNILNSPE